jgi:hypothetical protein
MPSKLTLFLAASDTAAEIRVIFSDHLTRPPKIVLFSAAPLTRPLKVEYLKPRLLLCSLFLSLARSQPTPAPSTRPTSALDGRAVGRPPSPTPPTPAAPSTPAVAAPATPAVPLTRAAPPSRAAHSNAARAPPTRRTQALTLESTSAPLRYFLRILFYIFGGLLFNCRRN